MKTLTAVILTQNDEHIIGYSIDGALRNCDEVIVVDGISQDKTESIIKSKAKELGMQKKLKYFKNRFVSLNAQRNFYLKHATSDYIVYQDSDEIIEDKSFRNIRELTEKYELILVRSMHFYIDFQHISTWDGFENSYNMPRCFKNLKGRLSYAPFHPKKGDHDLMIDTTEHFRKHWNAFQCICDRSEVVVYHYGYALGPEVQRCRMKFFLKQYSPEIPKEQYDEIINKNLYFNKTFWEKGINAEPVNVQKFNGHHPDIMQTHPLYNTIIIKD
jgi:glycosyltransferase involved in cell wall biosynthesis